jgi:hypothetical protein
MCPRLSPHDLVREPSVRVCACSRLRPPARNPHVFIRTALVHTRMRSRLFVCACVHTCLCSRSFVWAWFVLALVCVHPHCACLYTRACARLNTHVFALVCMRVCSHSFIRVCVHTHLRSCSFVWALIRRACLCLLLPSFVHACCHCIVSTQILCSYLTYLVSQLNCIGV